MNIESIKDKLKATDIFHSEENILNNPSVIGYHKKFRWTWFATQLNTFIVVTDFKDQEINQNLIEEHITTSFNYSMNHYNGWPRGFQSGVAVISILISTKITDEAKTYCQQLKSGKKWAGFSIPVVFNSETNELFQFQKNPLWGRIYYPYFKNLINQLS